MANKDTSVLSISLPNTMKEGIKKRVHEDQYGTPSDYIRSLIREDFKKRDQEQLEAMLLEGIRSPKGGVIGTKEWSDFRKAILARVQKKK